jgi:hypothetical protein
MRDKLGNWSAFLEFLLRPKHSFYTGDVNPIPGYNPPWLLFAVEALQGRSTDSLAGGDGFNAAR